MDVLVRRHGAAVGDAEALLHGLRDGVEARDERLGRLIERLGSQSDFKPKPPI